MELPAAPQTFSTALPVAKNSFVFRQQVLHQRASDDPDPADRDMRAWGSVSVLGYGITQDLAVFGTLPVLHKSLRTTGDNGQRIRRSTRGLGDARLFGRYTAYRDDAPGRTFRIAPFAGVEAPTGRDDDRDEFGRLPQPLQAGSGSWDVLGGVIATWQTLDYQLDGQMSYERNHEANGFRFGDVARLDGSLQLRLWPGELGPDLPDFVYGTLEANLIHRQRNRVGGIDDPDSGGTRLFLSPGLQYVSKRWILEATLQVPVAQDLGGQALKDDFAVRAGFRVNF